MSEAKIITDKHTPKEKHAGECESVLMNHGDVVFPVENETFEAEKSELRATDGADVGSYTSRQNVC